MLTRCPACGTRFRARPEHLQAAAGRVRCGRCGQIFDGRIHSSESSIPMLPHPLATPVPSRRYRAVVWRIVILILLIALPLQWLWWERLRLAADPYGQRLVIPLCRYLPCRLQLRRSPEHIEVLERSLEPDAQHPEVLHFYLHMVNRAPRPQPFPLLELRLLDAQAQVIAQRRFTPHQYRPVGAVASPPMLPDEPLQAQLDLLDSHPPMSGFQIDFR